MRAVTVEKSQLVGIITNNRAAHRQIFEEAVEGYKKEGIRLLEEHAERIKKGNLVEVYVRLPRPEDHTTDYDRVLKMLEMHSFQEIEIDQESFASYVMDDWTWKRQFLATNSAYSGTAMTAFRQLT